MAVGDLHVGKPLAEVPRIGVLRWNHQLAVHVDVAVEVILRPHPCAALVEVPRIGKLRGNDLLPGGVEVAVASLL